ncbi:hypothetical protein V2G26_015373 [Clonostachys chloroleuca]
MLVGLHNKMGKQGAYSAAELWWIPRPFTQRVEEVPIIEFRRCIHSPMMDESNPIILGLFIKDLTIQ